MPAIVEVKFYNSFLLRKTVTDTNPNPTSPQLVWNGSAGVPAGVNGAFPVYNDSTGTNQVVDSKSWYVEESRIEGGYSETEMLYGVKAYLVDDEPNASFRT